MGITTYFKFSDEANKRMDRIPQNVADLLEKVTERRANDDQDRKEEVSDAVERVN